ncbi:hypothetical protein [Streptomyces sp. NPDC091371]|uniref:hypothetical protein n=1 Tax=Streptomyces sp. NPDC091371 TaxID=3155303 RepID=UPI003440DE5F
MTDSNDSPLLDQRTDSQSERQIVLEVEGLRADALVGALTVGQLVQLLAQVLAQVPVRQRQPDAAELRTALQHVRETLQSNGGAGGNDAAILDAVRETQDSILGRLPDLLDGAAARAQDAQSGNGR